MNDDALMMASICVARRGFGMTAPNPSVGCVIASHDGAVIHDVTWTGVGGRPHAEEQALHQGGDYLHNARMAVTLEPCFHKDKNGTSCAQKIVKAGIKTLLIGMQDPDTRTQGKSIEYLRAHGVTVIENVCHERVRMLHEAHRLRIQEHRPWVTLKLALSVDGASAAADGSSRWISDMRARDYAHLLRARHDGVMVGNQTLSRDDPQLTTRLASLEHHSPLRFILGGDSIPAHAKAKPLYWLTDKKQKKSQEVIPLTCPRKKASTKESIIIKDMLTLLSKQGITRLLVEGGGHTIASFLEARMWDCLIIMRGNQLLGAHAKRIPLAIPSIKEALACRYVGSKKWGDNVMELYRPPDSPVRHAFDAL